MTFQIGHKLSGGKRKNAGRKTDAFRDKCASLADSPEFFEWAQKVFNGDEVDFRITKTGESVPVPASTSDRIYLWEKLAAYGFGKPASDIDLSQITAPLQKILNDNQAKRLMEEFNFADRKGKAVSAADIVGNGTPKIQAPFPAASSI